MKFHVFRQNQEKLTIYGEFFEKFNITARLDFSSHKVGDGTCLARKNNRLDPAVSYIRKISPSTSWKNHPVLAKLYPRTLRAPDEKSMRHAIDVIPQCCSPVQALQVAPSGMSVRFTQFSHFCLLCWYTIQVQPKVRGVVGPIVEKGQNLCWCVSFSKYLCQTMANDYQWWNLFLAGLRLIDTRRFSSIFSSYSFVSDIGSSSVWGVQRSVAKRNTSNTFTHYIYSPLDVGELHYLTAPEAHPALRRIVFEFTLFKLVQKQNTSTTRVASWTKAQVEASAILCCHHRMRPSVATACSVIANHPTIHTLNKTTT